MKDKADEKKSTTTTKARKGRAVKPTTGKLDPSTPTTVLISLSLADKKKLKFAAIERDMSVSALVREFIATL